MWTKLKVALAGVFLVAAAVACTPSATTVSANLTASADMNGGLPAKATIYYLRGTSAFNGADYASLASNAQATLGADLISTQDVLLSPGDTKTAGRSFEGDLPVAVGVIVGFRAIDTARWRASTSIGQGGANLLTVSIGAGSVSVTK
ncbi:MAG: type VI secretion system lipoprotein TssJ [Pseudomonadota bacterium]